MNDDHDENEQDARNDWMMRRVNLFGKVGMILCWYWDGSDDIGDHLVAIDGVAMLPDLLSGETQHFSQDDWWIFYDAIGGYLTDEIALREPELRELYQIAGDGFGGQLLLQKTKCFLRLPEDESDLDASGSDEEE